jgi:hypothetical protein
VIVPDAFTEPQPPVSGMEYVNTVVAVIDPLGVPEMVITLLVHVAVTPAGKPVGEPMPVAPVVAMVMGVSGEFRQSVGEEEGAPAVLRGLTVMVPLALTGPQPPASAMVKFEVPGVVGVPLMMMLFAFHEAVNPAGKPDTAPIPVAPVVAKVMGVMRVFGQSGGMFDGVVTVLSGFIVMGTCTGPEAHEPVGVNV